MVQFIITFVVSLCCVPLLTTFATPKECLAAEDGFPYIVKCGTTNQKSQISWIIKSPSGNVEYVSSACSGDQGASCNTSWANRITLTPRNDSEEGSLQLNIVTIRDEGTVIGCLEKDGTETFSTCVLQVYHKPELPVCQINKTGDNIVEMSCSTSKVFPGLACSFASYEENTKKVDVFSDNYIKYKSERTADGYFMSNCSMTVASLKNGTYNFFPVLQPNTSRPVKKSSIAVNPVKPILVLNSPRQLLVYRDELRPTSENCRVQVPRIVFVCEARGFNVQPTLDLLVGGVSASPMTTIASETTDGQIYRTVFKSNSNAAFRIDTDVLCLARTKDGLVSKLANFDQLEEARSTSRMLLDSNANHKLTCHGLTDSEDAKLKVTCFKDKKILLSSNALGANAEIALQVGFDSTTCVCLNTDERECFSYEAQFRIPAAEVQRDYRIYFIIFATISSCFFGVLILCVILLFRLSPKHGCGKGAKEQYSEKNHEFSKSLLIP